MNSYQPVQLLDESSRRFLSDRYSKGATPSPLDYATVRDFCDSADNLPQICYLNGDLKNVQRAWVVKTILGQLPVGSRLLEVGGGVPLVAGVLVELGYQVTIVDPYEGAGNGPVEYEAYINQFPGVTFVRDLFNPDLASQISQEFDCIYSISVLEHIPLAGIEDVFAGIRKFLKPQGLSLHCIDVVIGGNGAPEHIALLKDVFYLQKQLNQPACLRQDTDQQCEQMLADLKGDLEAFYLSAEGHHLWRGGMAYDDFPFRQVISAQTVIPYTGE